MIQLEWKHLIHSYIKLNDFINNMSNKHKIIDYEKFKSWGLTPLTKQAEVLTVDILEYLNDYKTGRFSSMLPQYTTNKHARRHMERLNVMSPYWEKSQSSYESPHIGRMYQHVWRLLRLRCRYRFQQCICNTAYYQRLTIQTVTLKEKQ